MIRMLYKICNAEPEDALKSIKQGLINIKENPELLKIVQSAVEKV